MVRPSLRRIALLAALLACPALVDPGAALAFTSAEARAPMTVTLVRGDAADCGADCPEWLALTGAITLATPPLLAAALARLGSRHMPILVDSPGGAVEAAMAMGRAIRSRKLDVVVAGTALTDCAATDRACAVRRRGGERPGFVAGGIAVCASSCVLLLASGTARDVGENSYVGVHQMSAKQTFTQTRTLFRVLRRREGNRIVEISRTPLSTRTVSSRTVQVKAPEALYSEVDRYLLGMGVGEAIMPLMRSAAPSSIHWISRAELAGTHLANDTTDARTLVARAARPPVPSPSAMALATATLGSGPAVNGIVDWRVDRTTGTPILLGTVDAPERKLHGTVRLRRVTDPSATDAYAITVDFGPPTAVEAGSDWTTEAPRLCDATTCDLPFTPAAAQDDGQGRRDFGVIPAWGDGLLSALRDRTWLTVGLRSTDGRHGALSLSLEQGAHAVVADWEQLCCGLAPQSVDKTLPEPSPAIQTPPDTVFGGASLSSPSGDAAGAAAPYPGDVTWQLYAGPGKVVHAGTADDLSGHARISGAELGIVFEAGAAGTDHPGDLLLDLRFTASNTTIVGPLTSVTAATTPAGGHIPMMVEHIDKAPGGRYRLFLAVPSNMGEDRDIRLMLGDGQGRLMTLSIPIPAKVAAHIAKAIRQRGAGAS